MARTMLGLFADRAAATRAVGALLDAGFTPAQVGVVHPQTQEPLDRSASPSPATTGAAVGGSMLGGTAGALLAATGALVIPGVGPFLTAGILASLVGGAAGWLAGALAAQGVPEEEAQASEERVQRGGILVVVKPQGRQEDAHAILLFVGAEKVRLFGQDDTLPATAGEDAPTGLPSQDR